MAGVLYAAFVCPAMAVPPVGTVYQRYCPALPPEAVTVTDDVPQALPPVVVGAVGIVLTVATTDVRALSHKPLLMET